MPRTNSNASSRADQPSASHVRTAKLSVAGWDDLSDDIQLMLSRQALRRAADIIAMQAEALAGEIENGGLTDLGGPEALRLLAAVVRRSGSHILAPAGEA